MPPHDYPSVDECFDRLHRAGWSNGGASAVVFIGTAAYTGMVFSPSHSG